MLAAAKPLESPLQWVGRFAVEFRLTASWLLVPWLLASWFTASWLTAPWLTVPELTVRRRIVPSVRRAAHSAGGSFREHRGNASMSRRVIAQHLASLLEPFFPREPRGNRSSDGHAAPLRTLLASVILPRRSRACRRTRRLAHRGAQLRHGRPRRNGDPPRRRLVRNNGTQRQRLTLRHLPIQQRVPERRNFRSQSTHRYASLRSARRHLGSLHAEVVEA